MQKMALLWLILIAKNSNPVMPWCIFALQAEAEYERKARKKELARQQGEGTWVLQSVDERVKHEEEVTSHKQLCIRYS